MTNREWRGSHVVGVGVRRRLGMAHPPGDPTKCEHRTVKLTGSAEGVLVNCDNCGVRFLPA